MVTQDVGFVVATDAIERAVELLTKAGFRPEKFKGSVNFKGHSKVSLQLSTEDFYRDFRAGLFRPTFMASCSGLLLWKIL